MRRIRSKNSFPELVVRRAVHSMGFRYRLHVSGLPGKPDLVFFRLGKIIEVHGCFWHQHAGCIDSRLPKSNQDYWIAKLKYNVERDLQNARELRKLGWRRMVVWECQTKTLPQLQRRLSKFLV